MAKPKLPAKIKEVIALHIKKGSDISSLIEPYDIRNEDFSGALIEKIDRPDEDISNTNFSNCIIGKDGQITNWCNTIAKNCNFRHTTFKGTTWMRRADMRGSSFEGAFVPYVDYRFGDFRGCRFCYTVFMVGTNKAIGSVFDDSFFLDMEKQWNIKLVPKQEWSEFEQWKALKSENNK